MNTTITTVLAALIIGGVAGYFAGNGATANSSDAKALQESVVMMKEQSASIQEMAQLMQSSGTLLQDMGMKYSDESAVNKGKDLSAVGTKYMKVEEDASAESEMMGEIMQ